MIKNINAITEGEYTGNDSADRAIAHRLGVRPKFVSIWAQIAAGHSVLSFTVNAGVMNILFSINMNAGVISGQYYQLTAADETSFRVGDAASYDLSQNAAGRTYRWTAYA